MDKSIKYLVNNGLTAMEQGNTLMALLFFQDAAILAKPPIVLSCLGFCIASEHRQFQKGVSLCQEALMKEPGNALHYLNLGRIYLLANQKPLALQVFRKSLKFGRNQKIIDEMKKLGVRQRPIFASLKRDNAFNKFFGLIFSRVGLR